MLVEFVANLFDKLFYLSRVFSSGERQEIKLIDYVDSVEKLLILLGSTEPTSKHNSPMLIEVTVHALIENVRSRPLDKLR